jgi:N-methylhydantoinase A
MIRVGIDIGGTFTDLVASDEKRGVWKVKVLTTPIDPSVGALDAVRRLVEKEKVDAGLVRVVVHATTLASNALLTGNIPKTALVTTSGFRDVLEIGRQNRPELYNLQVERLPPLVPRRYRFEVRERIMYDGGFWNRLIDHRLFWLLEGYEYSVLEPLLSAFFTPTPTRNTRRKWEKSSGENIPARNCPYLLSFFRSFENTREPARPSLMRVCSRCSLNT